MLQNRCLEVLGASGHLKPSVINKDNAMKDLVERILAPHKFPFHYFCEGEGTKTVTIFSKFNASVISKRVGKNHHMLQLRANIGTKKLMICNDFMYLMGVLDVFDVSWNIVNGKEMIEIKVKPYELFNKTDPGNLIITCYSFISPEKARNRIILGPRNIDTFIRLIESKFRVQ